MVTGITDENIPITSIKNDCFQSVTALPIYEDGDVLIESNENEDVSKSQSIIKALGLKAPRIKKVNEKVKIQPDENKNNLNIMKKYSLKKNYQLN